MKYLIHETNCGELWNDIALFENVSNAAHFIELHYNLLEDPVIEVVPDNYKFSEYSKKQFEKRFGKPWRIF